MATVDIEPASLAITPGESETITLTVGNDGDDVEAYHLTAVDDAARYVVIEPDTLLVHPGETVTAVATLTLAQSGRWRQGDLVLRFHIVPAGRPDDFVVVEAIAAIQSFSNVAAELAPPALEGRRSAKSVVTLSNAGNAHTSVEVAASAGELALFIDQPRAALPATSTESIGLTVRARSFVWRGEPVQHPFVVTVTPEGGQSISLEGTFTQQPVFAKWALTAAIGVGAVAVAALLLSVGAFVLREAFGGTPVAASPTATPTPTATEPPPPEPDVRMVVSTSAEESARAGDPLTFTLEPDVEDAPDGSRLAVKVVWEELTFDRSQCEKWVDAESGAVLEGRPQSGDECIVELSADGGDAAITFATSPAAVAGAVSAGATRLVTLDDDLATTLETGPGAEFGEPATAEVPLHPYLFWLQVVDGGPSDEFDAAVVIHHFMRGDGTDEEATMAFAIVPPAFVDEVLYPEQCVSFEDSICSVYYDGSAEDPTNKEYTIELPFDPDEPAGIGLMTVTGTSLDDETDDVDQFIRGDAGLVVREPLFDLDLILDPDPDPGPATTVTATIDVTAIELPPEVSAYTEGTWQLGLALEWPEGLELVDQPVGCELVNGVCTLRDPRPEGPPEITLEFVVNDSFEGGNFRASGASLSYSPTTPADIRDGREQPAQDRPVHWIESVEEWLEQ